MNENQTAQLSERVSAQRTGIVLHWQAYDPSTGVKGYQHNYCFVPKSHVEEAPGEGVGMLLMADSRLVTKYVYVSDDHITGNANNANTSDTISGVEVNNRYQALTEIFGI